MSSGAYFAGEFDTAILLFSLSHFDIDRFNFLCLQGRSRGRSFLLQATKINSELKINCSEDCRITRVCRSYDTGHDKTVIWEFDARISGLLN